MGLKMTLRQNKSDILFKWAVQKLNKTEQNFINIFKENYTKKN